MDEAASPPSSSSSSSAATCKHPSPSACADIVNGPIDHVEGVIEADGAPGPSSSPKAGEEDRDGPKGRQWQDSNDGSGGDKDGTGGGDWSSAARKAGYRINQRQQRKHAPSIRTPGIASVAGGIGKFDSSLLDNNKNNIKQRQQPKGGGSGATSSFTTGPHGRGSESAGGGGGQDEDVLDPTPTTASSDEGKDGSGVVVRPDAKKPKEQQRKKKKKDKKKDKKKMKSIEREMERIASNNGSRRSDMGHVDRIMTRISGGSTYPVVDSGTDDFNWRRGWRGIHLPPSALKPTIQVEKAAEKEPSTLQIESPADDEQAPIMEEHAASREELVTSIDATKVEEASSVDSSLDDVLPSSSSSSSHFLHPESYPSQPSVPLYPLLFCAGIYLLLKHFLFGRVMTYRRRTRLARGFKHRMMAIRYYGGNGRQFAISQEELEVQISKLKKSRENRKKKSKGKQGNEMSDISTADEDDDEDGANDGTGGNADGSSRHESDSKGTDEKNDDSDDKNNGRRSDGENTSGSDRGNSNRHGATNHQYGHECSSDIDGDGHSYFNPLKPNEELENVHQELETLSACAVPANERSIALAMRLTMAENDKAALVAKLETRSDQAKQEMNETKRLQERPTAVCGGQEGEIRWMKLNEELEIAHTEMERLSADLVCANERTEMMHEERESLLHQLECQGDELELQKERNGKVATERNTLRQELEGRIQGSELLSQVKRAKDALHAELERETMIEHEALEIANEKVERLAADLVCANKRSDMLRERLAGVEKETETLVLELAEQKAARKEFLSLAEAEKMKHNVELEHACCKVEQLTSDAACSNEFAEMLSKRLSDVKNEKDALATMLEQQGELHKAQHQGHAQQMSHLREENEFLLQKVAKLEVENEEMDLEMECLVDRMCNQEGDQQRHKGEDVEFDATNSVGSLWAESLTDDDDDDVNSNDGNDDNDNDGLCQELSAAKSEIARLTHERDSASQYYSIQLSKLKSQNHALLKKLLGTGSDSTSFSDVSQDLSTKMTAASTVVDADVTNVCFQNSHPSLITTATTIAVINDLTAELDCFTTDFNALTGDIPNEGEKKCEANINQLKEENEKVRSELDCLKEDLNTFRQKAEILSNKLSKANRQLEGAKHDTSMLAELKEENNVLEDNYSESLQKIDDLLQELAAARHQLDASNQKKEVCAAMLIENPRPQDQSLIVGFREMSIDESSTSFEDFQSYLTSSSEEVQKSSSELFSAVCGDLRHDGTHDIPAHCANNNAVEADVVEIMDASLLAKKSKAVPRMLRLWSSKNGLSQKKWRSKK